MKKSIWSLGAWFYLTVCACSGGEVDRPSRHEGELGALCETAEDCQEGLRCSTDLPNDDRFSCYVACAQDRTCPEESTCITSYSRSPDGARVEHHTCKRLCEDKEFCIELNPHNDDCDTFSVPNSPKICGWQG